jgi:hypothetical protein
LNAGERVIKPPRRADPASLDRGPCRAQTNFPDPRPS